MKQKNYFVTGRFFLSALFLCLGLCGCEDKALVLTKDTPAEGTEIALAEGSTASGIGKQDNSSADKERSADYLADNDRATKKWLYVHVCGAVKKPGVVRVPIDSRACDALEAAGGFAEDASQSTVNLAALLEDGQQLYFPTTEEQEVIQKQQEAKSAGKVNINEAGVVELCTLPGIGESRAKDIVAYREQNGGFKAPEELMKVSGIKDNLYQKIKDKITVE